MWSSLGIACLTASLAACGGGTPQPPPQPQPQGTIAGRLFAPTGQSVEGTIVVACYPKGEDCDPRLSGEAPQVLTRGQTAAYETRTLSAGQYTVIAVNDLNGDNTPSAGDLVGVHATNGKIRPVAPPANGIDIDLVVYQPRAAGAQPLSVGERLLLERALTRALKSSGGFE